MNIIVIDNIYHLTSGMFRSNLNLTQLIQTTLPLPRFLMLSRWELIWQDGSSMYMYMYIVFTRQSVFEKLCVHDLPFYSFVCFDYLNLIICCVLFTDICILCGIRAF